MAPRTATRLVAKAYEAIISLLEGVGYERHYGRTLLRRLEHAGLEDTELERTLLRAARRPHNHDGRRTGTVRRSAGLPARE